MHLTLFANPGIKVTILRRTPGYLVGVGDSFNQIKNFDLSYVDVAANCLPTAHGTVTLLLPTENWHNYVKSNFPREVSDIPDFKSEFNKFFRVFVRKWVEQMSIAGNEFRQVKHCTILDVVESLSKYFCEKPIDRKDFDKFYQEEK